MSSLARRRCAEDWLVCCCLKWRPYSQMAPCWPLTAACLPGCLAGSCLQGQGAAGAGVPGKGAAHRLPRRPAAAAAVGRRRQPVTRRAALYAARATSAHRHILATSPLSPAALAANHLCCLLFALCPLHSAPLAALLAISSLHVGAGRFRPASGRWFFFRTHFKPCHGQACRDVLGWHTKVGGVLGRKGRGAQTGWKCGHSRQYRK